METLQSLLAIASIFGVTIVCEKLPIKFSPYTAIKRFLVGDIENKINTLSDKFEYPQNTKYPKSPCPKR